MDMDTRVLTKDVTEAVKATMGSFVAEARVVTIETAFGEPGPPVSSTDHYRLMFGAGPQ